VLWSSANRDGDPVTETLNLRLVGSLLGLVAHDLRNPLSALHSNVGFLESLADPSDRDANEALADVSASCGSLKHIIDNLELLGLAVNEDRPQFDRGPVSLVEVTRDVISRIRVVAESYGVKLVLDGEPAQSLRVLAHREMFARAFGNLLFNSIQHGGSTAPVMIGVAADGNTGVITLSDPGPTLAESLQGEAFTAEGQLACKGESYGRYSRGLGLFSARVAAELAGAVVKSLPPRDQRNRFELRAPLAR
jgi:signal transduction histidine kinase